MLLLPLIIFVAPETTPPTFLMGDFEGEQELKSKTLADVKQCKPQRGFQV